MCPTFVRNDDLVLLKFEARVQAAKDTGDGNDHAGSLTHRVMGGGTCSPVFLCLGRKSYYIMYNI